jgi:hypothetical protein
MADLRQLGLSSSADPSGLKRQTGCRRHCVHGLPWRVIPCQTPPCPLYEAFRFLIKDTATATQIHFIVDLLGLHGTNTILPKAPGSRTSLWARGASASGSSFPTTGRSVPFSRPAMTPA